MSPGTNCRDDAALPQQNAQPILLQLLSYCQAVEGQIMLAHDTLHVQVQTSGYMLYMRRCHPKGQLLPTFLQLTERKQLLMKPDADCCSASLDQ